MRGLRRATTATARRRGRQSQPFTQPSPGTQRTGLPAAVGVSGELVDNSHFMLSVGSYYEVEERVQGDPRRLTVCPTEEGLNFANEAG